MKMFTYTFYLPLLFLMFFNPHLNAAVDCFVEDSSNGSKDLKQHCLPNEHNVPQDVLNIRGGITQIGNQIICVTNNDDLGECIDPKGHQNNDYGTRTSANAGTKNFLGNADYDDDTDTFSSSQAYLTLKEHDKILWARLQWMAQMDEKNEDNTLTSDARTIKFKTPTSGTYKDIQCDFYGTDTYYYNGVHNMTYKCSADVTDLVQESGDYWVANVDSELGLKNNYASWGLTVLYKNNNDPLVNVTLYEGYKIFWNQSANYFQINGFLTPLEKDVNAYLFLYAAEGDYGYTDYLEISTANNIAETSDVTKDLHGGSYVRILNPMTNKTSDFANGSISTLGLNVTNRTPNYTNSLGTDIDTVSMVDGAGNQVLSNKQTSTTLRFFAKELVTLSMIGTQINLHIPEFCYDYAYKQEGVFFTEENDGTKNPKIVGTVTEDEPVEVGIYVKNLVNSDIEVSDMIVNIIDINTSQVTYKSESTKVAEIGDLTAKHIPDDTLILSNSAVEDINIGTIYSNDYFYTYYKLNPNTSDLDMPLTISINYTLTYGGVPIPYNLILGSEIDMCSGSNFDYTPVSGIFNIVHDDYYNGSTSYYNLPTQVTKREGNFKVISMDETDNDQLKSYPTIVAVEMIDVSGFHDIDPTCKEMGSTISDKVWIIFDDNATSVSFNKDSLDFAIANNMTQLTNSYDFYTQARKNAAFRVTYNSMDSNNSVVNLVKDVNNNYSIANWKTEWSGKNCSQDMDNDSTTTDTVHDYCNLATGTLTGEDLANCMECIYGFDTKFICSRDNFSIRPEAFLINIDDQNQADNSSQIRLTTNYSGVAIPTPDLLNLASGYNYNIEINATSFLDNKASYGYTKSFNESTPDDTSQYIWEPRSSITPSACNDVDSQLTDIGFSNGVVDMNTSVNQIGEYRLNILDTTWTTVDHNPEYMKHHTGTYFMDSSVSDCIPDSTVVRSNNPYPTGGILNGCDISSSHTNENADLVYNDFDVTFHPYKFNMSSIVPSVGVDFNTTLNNNSFIYMSDMTFNNNQDQNSSFHLNGSIFAEGYDGSKLSNFTDLCYAKAINIDINNSDTTLTNIAGNAVPYQATLENLDTNGAAIVADDIDVDETNHQTPMQIQLTPSYFQKDLNGSVNTRLNLNFNKQNNLAVNPIRVSYNSYDVECTDPASDCTFSADLANDKTTVGSTNIDQNITHYYGRTHAPLYRYTGPSGVGLIYYEVYCSGAGCDKTLLRDGVNSRYNDDPRWFINTQHTASFGTAGAITQKGTRNNITADNAGTNVTTGNHPDSMTFTYDAVLGYPYKGTMQSNPSRWLVYNPYDADDTTNEFDIEYSKVDSAWSGVNSTGSSTSNDGAQRTNRRSMW